MKLLIINTNSITANGVTGVIFNTLRSIEKQDMQVDLISVNIPEESYTKEIQSYGGRIICFGEQLRTCKPIEYIKKLTRFIKDGNYDAVHAHGNSHTLAFEMIAAKLAECPVRIAHSHNTQCNSVLLHRLLTLPFNLSCTHRIACGDAAGKWLFGKKPFFVANNGICVERYRFNGAARENIRNALDIPSACKLIGHVGAFTRQKNHEFLLETFGWLLKKEKTAKLLLVGEGELLEQAKSRAEQLQISDHVIFAGKKDNPELYLSACDLFVMPSLHEGLPLVLIEAQTNGLQCIVSDAVTREADKTGLLTFMPLELGAEKWAEEIEKITINDDRTRESQIAAERIKECGYDISEEAARLKEYYFSAVAETGRKHASGRD